MKNESDKSMRGGRTCMWPIGDPSKSDFHFCGAKRIPARPYCTDHIQLAYQKGTKREKLLNRSALVSTLPARKG